MQVIPMGSDCLQGGTRWDRINAILDMRNNQYQGVEPTNADGG